MRFGLFDHLESAIERAVEGSIGRAFRNRLQPAEIARKLERTMIANQWISVHGPLVPNRYSVLLSPGDFANFNGSVDALSQQMIGWLDATASKRGLSTIGGLQVEIAPSDHVAPGTIQITTFHDESIAQPMPSYQLVSETEHFLPRRGEQERRGFVLVASDTSGGTLNYSIRKSSNVIGRALENDIVLEHPDVSRFHARLDIASGSIVIHDLGSTNGTWVNGYLAESPMQVFSGDTLMFGTLSCKLIIADS